MISLILSFTLLFANSFHVGQLAEYFISQKDDVITMKVILENDEMLGLNFKTGCDTKKTTSLCVANYILKNLHLEINEKKSNLIFDEAYTEKGHLILYFTQTVKTQTVKNLKVKNDCFYEYYNNYRNRVILDLGQFQNSYLLTSKKNIISIK